MNEIFKMLDVDCAVYTRVSTTMNSQKDSMENQQSFFDNYIKERNWRRHDIYADKGITGTSTAKRYELQRLMRDARAGKFKVVLVKSLSRWARDTVDSLTLVRELKSLGIVLITIDDNYNSEEDKNEMKLNMYAMFAQQESEAASKRVKFGIREKSRKGVFHGSPPYGYDKVKGGLVPNEVHAATVKLIYNLYLHENWGWQKIANHLTMERIPTPRMVAKASNAGDIWHETAVRLILKNPHYVGGLVQGRSVVNFGDKKQNSEKGYKSRIKIAEEGWIISENTHEAIILREDFKAVQEKIAFKGRTMFRGRGKKSLFARIAYCADCGKGMNYKNDREGYVCATYQKHGSKKCASHFIKHDRLKEIVISDLQNLSKNAIDRDAFIKSALKKVAGNTQHAQNDLNKAEKKFDKLKKELLELVRLLTTQVIDEETFRHTKDQLNVDLGNLEKKMKESRDMIEHEKQSEAFMKQFQTELHRFTELDISDENVLREVLQRLIEQVQIQGDGNIVIHYNFKNPLVMGA